MKSSFLKNTLILFCIAIAGVFFYTFTIRGNFGNPTAVDIKGKLDTPTKAFELSLERGRYAHIFELAQTGNFTLDRDWARVAYPDVGIVNGRMYSFFAPGVSYLALPLYTFGKNFNLAQVGAFATAPLASILTLCFLFLIAREIFKLPVSASLLGILIYAFGSTAWVYSITLYQHPFSVFFIVSGFYAAWRYSKKTKGSFISALYVGLAYGLAITVDYPNALLMLPVMIYFLMSSASWSERDSKYTFSFRSTAFAALLSFALITGLHFYHNQTYYGGWSKLAGGLTNYTLPTTTPLSTVATTTAEKSIEGFFKENFVPNGIFVLLFSSERGLFIFWPMVLMSFVGMFVLRKRFNLELYTALSLIIVNIALYVSWGDPWGGWAYGPRYLIPSMTWLSLFAVSAVYDAKFFIRKILLILLFAYTSALALLGALTTNAVPPKSEALLLPIKKYNFLLNIQFLQEGKSGSFFFNTYIFPHYTLIQYFLAIYLTVLTVGILLTLLIPRRHD